MKERPILFKGEMVRAILAGQKTQTRRIVKPQPFEGMTHKQAVASIGGLLPGWTLDDHVRGAYDSGFIDVKCPYGQPGDLLWVRENYRAVGYGGHGARTELGYERFETIGIEYQAGGDPREFHFMNSEPDEGTPANADYKMARRLADSGSEYGYRPSIHMPRWASRITLEITAVRVERLQEISRQDALAEGIDRWDETASVTPYRNYRKGEPGEMDLHCSCPERSFMTLWESINGPDSWNANPWVWVVDFKKVEELTA